ncbi:MAG: cupin domain-containing protein [Candidatus Bathyarchaeota archaeon]|jgi:quercetin dioxygenase-like cupin family protein|nr:cupin domain-containing protein [Candidatus Bathyarchaeota archaeon A05DMB-5]MDH7557978.1 cupin domain-containing protein [Candidatus Bathyarchaeota archaeon]
MKENEKEMKIINLKKFVEFSPEKGVLNTMEKRKSVKKDLMKTENYNLVLICLNVGQEIPSRPEPYAVCFQILECSGTFTVGNEEADLSSGEMLFVPANMPRGIKSKERLVLLGIQDPH